MFLFQVWFSASSLAFFSIYFEVAPPKYGYFSFSDTKKIIFYRRSKTSVEPEKSTLKLPRHHFWGVKFKMLGFLQV